MKNSVILEQSVVITPFGNLEETYTSLMAGLSAIRPGPVFDVNSAFAPFKDEKYRNLEYAASNIRNLLNTDKIQNSGTVFINCMAKGDIHCLEETVAENSSVCNVSPLTDQQGKMAASLLGISPAKTLSISNACASGSIAVETAMELLSNQRYEYAVVFGLESLCRFVASGFFSLSALSVKGARPFDRNRDGLSLGETVAAAVFSFREPEDGDIIISGAGSSNDANHRTGPSRTGDGLRKAAESALSDASMKPEDIGAVKCHGTATVYNDAMEAKAINKLFIGNIPPCVSLKGALGHSSGAGSLAEIIIASECLKNMSIPPTSGYAEHGVDEKIPVSSAAQTFTKPSMLCLAAGFGGVNSAVIISRNSK